MSTKPRRMMAVAIPAAVGATIATVMLVGSHGSAPAATAPSHIVQRAAAGATDVSGVPALTTSDPTAATPAPAAPVTAATPAATPITLSHRPVCGQAEFATTFQCYTTTPAATPAGAASSVSATKAPNGTVTTTPPVQTTADPTPAPDSRIGASEGGQTVGDPSFCKYGVASSNSYQWGGTGRMVTDYHCQYAPSYAAPGTIPNTSANQSCQYGQEPPSVAGGNRCLKADGTV